MDDLLREFLTESGEHLDTVDAELVRFEQDPNNQTILRNIFRLVHTIKGTCGFLGLPRLEALAHAAETLMGRFRDGLPATSESVTVILSTLDRLKAILADLEATGTEPAGSDDDLISELERLASAEPEPQAAPAPAPEPVLPDPVSREPKPGEVTLDELEAAFLAAPGPSEADFAAPAPAPVEAPKVEAAKPAVAKATAPKPAAAKPESSEPESGRAEPAGDAEAVVATETTAAGKIQTIRVNVDTLEHLMTMVSELVLTRNQLLEIARRHEDSSYKVPLQRLSHVTAELQEGVMKTRMQPIGSAWQKLPRVVRDLSAELGKQIDLVMVGAETELDRQVLEVIKDPLTHMVRNSADHGLESTAGPHRGGQAGARHDPPRRLPRGRHDHDRDRRRRQGPRPRGDPQEGGGARTGGPGRCRADDRRAGRQVHLRRRVLDRGGGHLGVGPRRRHGRGSRPTSRPSAASSTSPPRRAAAPPSPSRSR